MDTVVIAIQHDDLAKEKFEGSEREEHSYICSEIMENVIKTVIPTSLLDSNTKIIINGTGRFVLGGPHADAGLTGRKIIVDTYGGMGRHGGGPSAGRTQARSIGLQPMLLDGLLNTSSPVALRRNARYSWLMLSGWQNQ